MGGIDVGDEGDVRGVVERAIEGSNGLCHRGRNERVQLPGKQKHPIAVQSGEVVNAARRRRGARGGDTTLRVGRPEERSGVDMRANAQRPEQAPPGIVAGTEVRSTGEDCRTHQPCRMRDMKLMREECAGRDSRYRNRVRIDTQRGCPFGCIRRARGLRSEPDGGGKGESESHHGRQEKLPSPWRQLRAEHGPQETQVPSCHDFR